MDSNSLILTINGGSSSIKFSVCENLVTEGGFPRRTLAGAIERIGIEGTSIHADGEKPEPIEAKNHRQAVGELTRWLEARIGKGRVGGIGHRVVHGGFHLVDNQLVTDDLVAELKRTQPLDLAHLPREIALIESMRTHFKGIPQVACFDTAFHRDLPRVAHLMPIPRSYDRAGVRRFGFHGLSYTYLMLELRRIAGDEVADGRLILAHLGSGASMAAVKAGKPIDTTMAFTPTAGLVMGTRPGDLDPGLLVYLMRVEGLTPSEADEFISNQCGLLGVSETTSDMRDLLERRGADSRAAEAVDLFCYQAKKWLGAYAAALGGVDTIVFSGGIGEHAPEVRGGICEGLEFLGIELDQDRNRRNEAVISRGQVTVRVMSTDEEAVIARATCQVIDNC
jgi:acetate kinase